MDEVGTLGVYEEDGSLTAVIAVIPSHVIIREMEPPSPAARAEMAEWIPALVLSEAALRWRGLY